MNTPHTDSSKARTLVVKPKRLPKKTVFFSTLILLIAILGTTAPFAHMLFPKENPLIKNLKSQYDLGKVTDEEYRVCYREFKQKNSIFKYRNMYKLLTRIGSPMTLCCCAFLILYCIRFIAHPRITMISWVGGILFLLSGIHSTLYWLTKKNFTIDSYKEPLLNPIVYHVILGFTVIILTSGIVLFLHSYVYPKKINRIITIIVNIRSTLYHRLAKSKKNKIVQNLDNELYTTLSHIVNPITKSHSYSNKRIQQLILGLLLSISILGSISPQVYHFVPNPAKKTLNRLKKQFWKEKTISLKKAKQEWKIAIQRLRFIKYSPFTINTFYFRFGTALGLFLSALFLLLIARHIYEPHAKRGTVIAGISFLCIALFFLAWIFIPKPSGKHDFHINYYYAMMSISVLLTGLVVFQFVQSIIHYKYKMMELLHFVVGARKMLFTSLAESTLSKLEIQQAQEEFDEQLYETLDDITKKK